jgi:sphingomyelin phosphodiesterase
LASTLQQAETTGEKVHIIGHVGPSSCLDSWRNNYYRIANRYESTIAGQFFGHTHSDEFHIMYDIDDPTRAFSLTYMPGSATTYSFLNPGYRIYEVDGAYASSSYEVLNYRNVYMNLTEANSGLVPVWRDEYTAKVNKKVIIKIHKGRYLTMMNSWIPVLAREYQ